MASQTPPSPQGPQSSDPQSSARVLVLGASGMLGSMVFDYLRRKGFDVYGTVRSKEMVIAAMSSGPGGKRLVLFDAALPVEPQLLSLSMRSRWDYIINCIGIIKPYCKDNDAAGVRLAIRVNAQFPHELGLFAKQRGVKVIQIATDCVYSGKDGRYREDAPHDALDVYGKTKSLGEPFDGSVLNIRTSIIGPERKGKLSLLEWFFSQKDGAQLKGFTHHRWNGITTLRFAQLCEAIIRQDAYGAILEESAIHHCVPTDAVDKHELLSIFKDVFLKDVTIAAVGGIGAPVDRTLSTKFTRLHGLLPPMAIREDVRQLRQYMDENDFYNS